jgi:hypothetical protein
MTLALYALWQRRSLKIPLSQATQYILGFSVPLLLAEHVTNTRIDAAFYGGDFSHYRYLLSALWYGDPAKGLLQMALLLAAWTHACIGLRFWLAYWGWRTLRVGARCRRASAFAAPCRAHPRRWRAVCPPTDEYDAQQVDWPNLNAKATVIYVTPSWASIITGRPAFTYPPETYNKAVAEEASEILSKVEDAAKKAAITCDAMHVID